jgi:hypothetical protein
MRLVVIAILLVSIIYPTLSQPIYIDKRNDREYYIYRDSDPDLIKDFLKQAKAEAIEFSPYDETYLLKDKDEKWHMYSDLAKQVTFKGYDSIGFVTPDVPYTVVKNLNKYGILKSPFEFENAESGVQFLYNGIKSVKKDGKDYLIAKRGRKWAQIDWFTGVNYTPFIYTDFREIDFKELPREELEFINAVRRKKGFDYVYFDRINGKGIFIGRQRRTRKWGMLQGKDVNNLIVHIPNEYDSLDFFPSDNTFIPVFLGGKVGFYNKTGNTIKKISDPQYEDYKRAEYNEKEYLAVQKNGKWGWVDWYDGEIKVKSISNSFEELPAPDWISKFYTK